MATSRLVRGEISRPIRPLPSRRVERGRDDAKKPRRGNTCRTRMNAPSVLAPVTLPPAISPPPPRPSPLHLVADTLVSSRRPFSRSAFFLDAFCLINVRDARTKDDKEERKEEGKTRDVVVARERFLTTGDINGGISGIRR